MLAQLGEGAMGQVYLARHRDLGRKDAIKVLKPRFASETRFVARFRREARATSRLHHANIVAMYDYGQLPDGRFYIAMEYVDGAPLSSLLREEEILPAPRAVDILCQLAAAVEHAHSRGVLHRDLKPANLMLVEQRGRDDVLKVLDFGVAKIISPEYTESVLVSQEGTVFGTPLYMAPEQFYNGIYDPRSDLYALGCVAFELLTGEPPFYGPVSEVIRGHTEREPPRPGDCIDGIPGELERIILRCLEKKPSRRYQSGGELLRDLVMLHPRHQEIAGSTLNDPVPNLARYDIYRTLSQESSSISSQESGQESSSTSGQESSSTSGQESSSTVASAREHARRAHQDAAPLPRGSELEQALFVLGQRLLDRDTGGNIRLAVTMADVRALETALAGCEADCRALSARRSTAGDSARERMERLAHAIAALEAERERGSDDTTLDYQIRMLERRREEVAAEDQAAQRQLVDEAAGLDARRAKLEVQRPPLYARLGGIVDEIIAELGDAPNPDDRGGPGDRGDLDDLVRRYRACAPASP
jgi:serine/threonine protein kinase